MRKICAISGMPLITASHFSNYFTRSVHPLMEVRTEKLLKLVATKSWMDWQEEEAKLLLLALANSLDLIEVTEGAVANPSQQVIASSIEPLVAICGWYTVREFPLPKLRITATTEATPSNETMQEFPSLLNTIIASRAETLESDKLALEAIRLEETIKLLYSKCSIGANKHSMLRTKAADWAIKITAGAAKKERVTADIQQLWHKMLTTPPVDAHKFDVVDIKELDEFMVCNLPHGCTASYEVMKHLTAIKNATTQLANFLGIDNLIEVIDTSPMPEAPVESAFASKLDFLIAKAKYQEVKSRKEQAAAITATKISTTEVAILDSDDEGEDDELSAI